MSVLLPTNLPLAINSVVSPETYNQLVRVLELNLGQVDAAVSPHFSTPQRDKLQFATGAIIFNTTVSKHQGFNGTAWADLY
tara:strand:- start:399 stop:641 length:243 start_codon:yes stop_codon:yes gene_type:complete